MGRLLIRITFGLVALLDGARFRFAGDLRLSGCVLHPFLVGRTLAGGDLVERVPLRFHPDLGVGRAWRASGRICS